MPERDKVNSIDANSNDQSRYQPASTDRVDFGTRQIEHTTSHSAWQGRRPGLPDRVGRGTLMQSGTLRKTHMRTPPSHHPALLKSVFSAAGRQAVSERRTRRSDRAGADVGRGPALSQCRHAHILLGLLERWQWVAEDEAPAPSLAHPPRNGCEGTAWTRYLLCSRCSRKNAHIALVASMLLLGCPKIHVGSGLPPGH